MKRQPISNDKQYYEYCNDLEKLSNLDRFDTDEFKELEMLMHIYDYQWMTKDEDEFWRSLETHNYYEFKGNKYLIDYSFEDCIFWAKLVSDKHLILFEGKTLKELYKDIEDLDFKEI